MNYKKNKLYIENLSVQKIAKKFGTPAYCYSLTKLKNKAAKRTIIYKDANFYIKLCGNKCGLFT